MIPNKSLHLFFIIQMRTFKILVAGLLSAVLISCNHSTETTGGSSVAWTTPTPGTMFVYRYTNRDLTYRFDTLIIIEVGKNIGGKSNVVRLKSGNSSGFYSFEANGDISFGDSSSKGFSWNTFPTGSRQAISDPLIDTFYGTDHYIKTSVRSFVDAETITEAGMSLSVLKCSESWRQTSSGGPYTDSSFETTDFWFAPTIGLFAKSSDVSTDIYSGVGDSSSYVSELVLFSRP